MEVHVTNIHQRKETYRHSLVSKVAQGVICELGDGGVGAGRVPEAEVRDLSAPRPAARRARPAASSAPS